MKPTGAHDIWTLLALLGHDEHRDEWDARPAEIRALLAGGADPEAGREPPLVLAAQIGHLAVARVLLEFGADVHAGRTYRTPLFTAGSHPGMRSLLLDNGASETAFSFLSAGDDARFQKRLKNEPELATVADEAGMTLLFHAARARNAKATTLLLDAGADPNAVAADSYGISPIHEAGRGPDDGSELIRLLHARGARLDTRNKGGVTALHMAVRDRNVAAVRSLLELGASVDPEDRGRKSTPLRRAVANTGRSGTAGKTDAALEIVRLLLAHGADPQHRNATGRTVVESTRNAAVAALLAGD